MSLPNLTQPELMSLRENISAEMLMIEKFNTLAQQCSDSQLKQVLTSITSTHEKHRDTLMRHLNDGNMM